MEQDEFAPDSPLTAEQTERVKQLAPAMVEEIDTALLSNVSIQWRKVAKVVATAMLQMKPRPAGIPDVYYARRIAMLVKPFVWTAKAHDILAKVIRANRHLSSKQNEALH